MRRDWVNVWYALDEDRNPVPCSLAEFAEMYQLPDRIVDKTYIGSSIEVSTVFLGLDHNYGFDNETRPVVFETMIFGGALDEFQLRYCTWADAEAGHKAVVAQLMARYIKEDS